MLEIRFKPDVTLDVEGIGEVIMAKKTLCTQGEPDVLAIIPPDMEMDTRVITLDHHSLFGGCGNSRRLAFAAQSHLNRKLAEIHFRYHPRPYDTAVFLGEDEARAWLSSASRSN